MNMYLFFKFVHIVSSTVLFGTGIGIAFFKWMTDRSGDVRAMRVVNERTVLADWCFTTPAVIVQPLSGLALIELGGYPWQTGWLVWAVLLYLFAGACWLPVVWLQYRMRALSRDADQRGQPLPPQYRVLARCWFWLGVPAFCALMFVFWLMVTKPVL